jgi:Uma2 family endonuclease
VLGIYVETKNLGKVVSAPFQMYLSKVKRGRKADIIFISNSNLCKLNTIFLEGPEDLVIEILSTESRLRDLKLKYAEYEEAGVFGLAARKLS